MCTIAAHAPGVKPVKQHLLNAMKVSPHGFGYAMRGPGQDGEPTMLFCKSLNGDMMLEQFIAMREQFPDDWAVFWARRSTGTLVSLDNCQPLMVGKDNPETLFFHNGQFCEMRDRRVSDSRLMADEIGKALDTEPHSLDGAYLSWLDENHFRANGSKGLIITSHPRWQHPVYFLNHSQWHFADGVAYSNSEFMGPGTGYDDMVLEEAPADPRHGLAGDTWRYRITQPGQCGNCGDFAHDEDNCPAPRSKTPLAWRNESQNDRILAALAKRYA